MRQFTVITILISALLIFSSCSKDDPDPCENVVCLNGGACVNGSCNCPEGYSGAQCETFDDCFNVTCLNGGTCVNGICNCPDGYTGSDCSQQITPSRIRISKIDITRFPATDNGAGWDLTSGPDIYPELSLGNTVLYSANKFFQNADPANDYSFELSPLVNMNEPEDQYTIRLFDFDDFDADDFMGGINFTPYFDNNGFPSTLNVDAGGDVAFTLHVTYDW